MYLKFTGWLLDILGDAARGDLKATYGIDIRPEYQSFDDPENPITLSFIIDESKFPKELLDDPRVSLLETKEDFNNAIDQHFKEKYILVDISALQFSLQFNGKTAADIPNYDTSKPISDQDNLKALYEAGALGIKKVEKPKYI